VRLKQLLDAQLRKLYQVRPAQDGLLEISLPSPLASHTTVPVHLNAQKEAWYLTDIGTTLKAMQVFFEGRDSFQTFLNSEAFPKVLEWVGLVKRDDALIFPTQLPRLAGDLFGFTIRIKNLWDHADLMVTLCEEKATA
jgi:hypothetical protein